MSNLLPQRNLSHGEEAATKEKTPKDVFCVYCPTQLAKERSMSTDLRFHMAACHIDLGNDPSQESLKYACDGNSIEGEFGRCTPEKPFETLAASQFVDHMEEEHPAQGIPFQTRYKAALSDFMTEWCILKNMSPQAEASRRICLRTTDLSLLLAESKKNRLQGLDGIIAQFVDTSNAETSSAMAAKEQLTASIEVEDVTSNAAITDQVGSAINPTALVSSEGIQSMDMSNADSSPMATKEQLTANIETEDVANSAAITDHEGSNTNPIPLVPSEGIPAAAAFTMDHEEIVREMERPDFVNAIPWHFSSGHECAINGEESITGHASPGGVQSDVADLGGQEEVIDESGVTGERSDVIPLGIASDDEEAVAESSLWNRIVGTLPLVASSTAAACAAPPQHEEAVAESSRWNRIVGTLPLVASSTAVACAAPQQKNTTPRGRVSVFTSKEYYEILDRLKLKYLTPPGKERKFVSCKRCQSKMIYHGSRTCVSHAITHTESPAFVCALCTHQSRSAAGRGKHFRRFHRDQQQLVAEGKATMSDYMIDKRGGMESEVVKLLRECFDI